MNNSDVDLESTQVMSDFKELNIDFKDILHRKQLYYGHTEAAHDFAVEEYSTRNRIDENKYIMRISKDDLSEVTIILIENRIVELESMINNA